MLIAFPGVAGGVTWVIRSYVYAQLAGNRISMANGEFNINFWLFLM